MSEWADGYVVDIPYSTGFYRELTPTWLNFTALVSGVGAPSRKAFSYAELGCGLGHGTALMAATHPHGDFWGFDFNPQQIGIATRLSTAAGLTNVHFREKSFEELATEESRDIPAFDYIVMHGIWTWVSEVNRKFALAFIAKYLKPNGIVYVSYNCNVGWMAMAPLQQFMRAYASTLPGNSADRAKAAFGFAQGLSQGGAMYFKANTQIDRRLELALAHDAHYLAHEYMNGNWYLPSHLEVRQDFEAVKCDYVGSATPLDNFDAIMLPTGVRDHLKRIARPELREAARDLATNNGFRRDLYMRGTYRLTPQELQKAWARVRLLPVKQPSDGKISVKTSVGEVSFQEDLYSPLLDALFSRGSLGFDEAISLGGKRRAATEVQQVFGILLQSGIAHPEADAPADEPARRFNRALYSQLLDGHDLNFMAMPRHGSGIGMTFIDAALLEAMRLHPDASPKQLAAEVWNQYKLASRRPAKGGKPLTDAASALEVLEAELNQAHVSARRADFIRQGLLD